jgi:ribosomal protein S18 acetylase RimI-like enzyme
MIEIRLVKKEDFAGLKALLDSIGLFHSDMLDEMISNYFNNPHSKEVWFIALENHTPVSFGYCGPERLTEGTYNLYAIGVKPGAQRTGNGSRMMRFIEDHLRQKGQRLLIVDTSGSEAYASARKFYEKLSYTREAVIRDFWKEGEDKVTFWKKLS